MGTEITRAQVNICGQRWFLGADHERVALCPDHVSDDFRDFVTPTATEAMALALRLTFARWLYAAGRIGEGS